MLVVMGVSGSGKTTIGSLLAAHLKWRYADGDAFHSPQNIAKMHAGVSLDDEDRAPWLAAVAAQIDRWRSDGASGVIACSALKRRYRAVLIGARPDVRLVYLKVSRELLAQRLAHRQDHFMPASLLDEQLATLEEPGADERPITVDAAAPPALIVERIAAALAAP